MSRPSSPSCLRNRAPILEVLQAHLPKTGTLLEIGSGSGQHACYLAPEFPELIWQTSELPEHHAGILAWLAEDGAPNIREPLLLDVTTPTWPITEVDAVFSANTAHYMSWPAAQAMLSGIANILAPGGIFILYGPFNYGGRFTSESNKRFEGWLKGRNPDFAIRDFEAIEAELGKGGVTLKEDWHMPANNRALVFWRQD